MSNDPHDKDDKGEGLSRRGALAAAAITSVAAVTGVAAASGGTTPQGSANAQSASDSSAGARSSAKMPVIFVPHGGGPWPWMDLAFGTQREKDEMLSYLQGLPASLSVAPRAIVVVSAHWEEPIVTVMNGERPPLYFDYSGFPPETYRLTWAAPGNPTLAQRVIALLNAAGIATGTNSRRGFDHGTFVPLKVAWPAGDVPVVQVSLKTGLDPEQHLAMGRALAPLRDEGVLLVGSGMTYHNMRGFFSGGGQQASEAFDRWLREATAAEPATRDRMLREWANAPYARAVHPREEHLIPLMVIAGAAGNDRARVPYNGTLSNLRLSAHHFG